MADYLKRIVARGAAERAPVLLGLPRSAPEAEEAGAAERLHAVPEPARPLQLAPGLASAEINALRDVPPPAPVHEMAPAMPSKIVHRVISEPPAPSAEPERSAEPRGTPEQRVALPPAEPARAVDPLEAMDREIRRLLHAAQRADAEPVDTESERAPAETRSLARADARERAPVLPRLEPPAPHEPAPARSEPQRLVIGRVLVEVAPPAPAAPPAAPQVRAAPAPQPFRAGDVRGVAFRRSFGWGQS